MGVINLGLLVDKIAKKLEGAGFIKSTDYASASKAGVVKVGEGLDITDAGVLSASGGGGGGFNVDVIFSEADPQDTSISFTFPEGKSISDYTFLLLATNYTGSSHTCVTSLVPTAQIVANTSVLTALWYDAQWNVSCNVTATGCNSITGQYKINKVYAF